jgi:hypothetical protein
VGAVAHHQPPPALVTLAGEPGDVGVDLGLQRLGQQPPGALPDDLVDQRLGSDDRSRHAQLDTTVGAGRLIGDYGEHGSYLPDRRCRAGLA